MAGYGGSQMLGTYGMPEQQMEYAPKNGYQQEIQSPTFQAFSAVTEELNRINSGVDQLYKRLEVVMTGANPDNVPLPQPPPADCQLARLGVELFTKALNVRVALEGLLNRLAI